jgi:hypothetical protein
MKAVEVAAQRAAATANLGNNMVAVWRCERAEKNMYAKDPWLAV